VIGFVLALALPRAVTVETVGCDALDGGEIGRLLLLELATEATPAGDLRVAVECEGTAVTVRIGDPGTGRVITRVIDMPAADDPSRHRLVALAAAQLLAAGWMELREPPRHRDEQVRPRERRRAFRGRRSARTHLAVEPGLRARTLEDPLFVPRLALRGGVRTTPRWMPFVSVGVEAGEIDRPEGAVSLLGVSAAVGVATRLAGFLDASASLGLAYLRMSGAPRPDFEGGITDGLRIEPAASLGPTIETRRFQLGLDIAAGLTLPSLDAEILGGSPVTTGTVWLGLSLRLGLLS